MIGDTNEEMDVDRFARELPALFDDFPRSERPRGARFDDVVADVPNLAEENNLALVNLAASLREPDESYVEVGSYLGASLIAAARGNEGTDVVGLDDFSFPGVKVRGRKLGPADRAQLDANLERFGAAWVTVMEGDAFALVREGGLAERQVGAYYYDASHSYEHQLEGLRVIEPYLAERALMIVDDSDWDDVGRATRDYLATQPKARLLFEIGGEDQGQPWWWEGVMVLAWEA